MSRSVKNILLNKMNVSLFLIHLYLLVENGFFVLLIMPGEGICRQLLWLL